MSFSHHIEQKINRDVTNGWMMRIFQTRSRTSTSTRENTGDSKIGISVTIMESKSYK